jgi:hypothetical protein
MCSRDPILPRGSLGFTAFKELCPGVPQNSVRDAIRPGFFHVIRVRQRSGFLIAFVMKS